MRPTVRRIDLTQTPTAVEEWPSLDWLEPTGETNPTTFGPTTFGSVRSRTSSVGGSTSSSFGRRGLWDAMASAIERARESSLDGSMAEEEEAPTGAEVIEMPVDTPHLAYLARVACTRSSRREALPGADVIAFVDARTRDAS